MWGNGHCMQAKGKLYFNSPLKNRSIINQLKCSDNEILGSD